MVRRPRAWLRGWRNASEVRLSAVQRHCFRPFCRRLAAGASARGYGYAAVPAGNPAGPCRRPVPRPRQSPASPRARRWRWGRPGAAPHLVRSCLLLPRTRATPDTAGAAQAYRIEPRRYRIRGPRDRSFADCVPVSAWRPRAPPRHRPRGSAGCAAVRLLPAQGAWREREYLLWLTERTDRLIELADGRVQDAAADHAGRYPSGGDPLPLPGGAATHRKPRKPRGGVARVRGTAHAGARGHVPGIGPAAARPR